MGGSDPRRRAPARGFSFSTRTQIGLLGGNGLVVAVNTLGRALYSSNWLIISVRLRHVLSMCAGFALMQFIVLTIIKRSRFKPSEGSKVASLENPEEEWRRVLP